MRFKVDCAKSHRRIISEGLAYEQPCRLDILVVAYRRGLTVFNNLF